MQEDLSELKVKAQVLRPEHQIRRTIPAFLLLVYYCIVYCAVHAVVYYSIIYRHAHTCLHVAECLQPDVARFVVYFFEEGQGGKP